MLLMALKLALSTMWNNDQICNNDPFQDELEESDTTKSESDSDADSDHN